MSQRDIFPEDYESYCKKLAPFEMKEDLRRTVRDRKETLRVVLKPVFWEKTDIFFKSLPKKLKKKSIKDVNELLETSFIVGENHSDVSPKKFIIKNMQALKAAGFTTLYLEHLYYDDQKLLDDYLKTGVMDEKLKEHLQKLDRKHGVPDELTIAGDEIEFGDEDVGDAQKESPYFQEWDKFNFMALVEAARTADIRIVAIDVKAVYESQEVLNNTSFALLYKDSTSESTKRMQCMNYTAQAIIRREQAKKEDAGEKWLAIMGNAHVNKQVGVPGVADIFNVPAVYFFDARQSEKSIIKFDTERKIGDHSLTCDICIVADRHADTVKLQQPEKKLEKR